MEGTEMIKEDCGIKQGFEMKKGIIINSLLIGGTLLTLSVTVKPALAMMNLAARCKDNFNGRVISVNDSQTPLSRLPKIDVEFEVESASEKDSQTRTISIVKNGPHKFEVGEDYQVGLNQGFVCRIERL